VTATCAAGKKPVKVDCLLRTLPPVAKRARHWTLGALFPCGADFFDKWEELQQGNLAATRSRHHGRNLVLLDPTMDGRSTQAKETCGVCRPDGGTDSPLEELARARDVIANVALVGMTFRAPEPHDLLDRLYYVITWKRHVMSISVIYCMHRNLLD
jgi:hypothetical protein